MEPIDWREKANPQLELLLKVRTKDAKPTERPEGTPYTPEEIAAWNREAEGCSAQQPYDKYKEKLSEDIVDDKNKKYIYESSDGGQTIYRREFDKSEKEVVKDWQKKINERKSFIERADKGDQRFDKKIDRHSRNSGKYYRIYPETAKTQKNHCQGQHPWKRAWGDFKESFHKPAPTLEPGRRIHYLYTTEPQGDSNHS